MAAYAENRKDAADQTFDNDLVAPVILRWITQDHPLGWEGTATELLEALSNRVDETRRRQRAWPQTAAAMGNRLERIAPLLERRGLVVTRRHSGTRTIHISPPIPK
jgi:putative DNA primase/helicase